MLAESPRAARRTVPAASTGWASRGSWGWLSAAWGVWGWPEGRVSTCTPILDTLGPGLMARGAWGGSGKKLIVSDVRLGLPYIR